jgi:glycosyltransferase involved in cell wall biosynthesis
MKEHYKVSIIVPIYNTEPFLKTCLESIVGQSYKNLEILLIDDGSTDDSPAICDTFAVRDSRIKLIHKANQGVSLTRNYALNICSGDFVTFVDSDDWLEPDAIKILIEIYVSSKADLIVASNYDIICSSDKSHSQIFPSVDWSTYDIIENLAFICEKLNVSWGKLYKTDLIQCNNIRFNSLIPYGEDTIFNLDYLIFAKNITLSSKILYNYNQLNESAANKKFYSEFYSYMISCQQKVKELLFYHSSIAVSSIICEKCALRFFDLAIFHYTNAYKARLCDKKEIINGLTKVFKYFRNEISLKTLLKRYGILKSILFKSKNVVIFLAVLEAKKMQIIRYRRLRKDRVSYED